MSSVAGLGRSGERPEDGMEHMDNQSRKREGGEEGDRETRGPVLGMDGP